MAVKRKAEKPHPSDHGGKKKKKSTHAAHDDDDDDDDVEMTGMSGHGGKEKGKKEEVEDLDVVEEEPEDEEEGEEEEEKAEDDEAYDTESNPADGSDTREYKSYVKRFRTKDVDERQYMENIRIMELQEDFENLDKLGENYVGVGHLGKGGQGSTRLFVTVNQYQRITARLAVKECYPSIGKWHKRDMWYGEGRENPREGKLHELCSSGGELDSAENAPGNQNIVKCYGFYVSGKMTFQIFMEYMSWGDMDAALKAQLASKIFDNPQLGDPAAGDDYDEPTYTKDRNSPPPEAFIWYYLKQMATACKRMQKIPGEDGKEVVHQDLKPSNIFMGPPDPNSFPKYPILKVGDFGSARLTWAKDTLNPAGFLDAVTPGWIPPEISVDEDGDPVLGPEIASCATNIWQIGRIAMSMMDLHRMPEQLTYIQDEEIIPVLEDITRNDYSIQLQAVLRRCVRMWPQDRITPDQLLQEVENNKDKYNAMEGGEAWKWSSKDEWLHYWAEEKFLPGDPYKSEENEW